MTLLDYPPQPVRTVEIEKAGWQRVADIAAEAKHQLKGTSEDERRMLASDAARRAGDRGGSLWGERADEWRRLSIADYVSRDAMAHQIALDRALVAGIRHEPARTGREAAERLRYKPVEPDVVESVPSRSPTVLADSIILDDIDQKIEDAFKLWDDEDIPVAEDPVEGGPEVLADVEPGPKLYTFPVPDSAAPSAADRDLLAELGIIANAMEQNRLDQERFEEHRRRYCALAIELNRRGIIAPLYRPRMKAPDMRHRLPADNLHSNDLQVIDLNWLHSREPSRPACTKTMKPLFGGGSFDFDFAADFAARPWPAEKKAKALRLYIDEEWELASICPTSVRGRLRTLYKGRERLNAVVASAARLQPQLRACGAWGDIWVAMQIVEIQAGTRSVKPVAVSRQLRSMTGIEKERRSLGVQMVRLNDFLAETRSTP